MPSGSKGSLTEVEPDDSYENHLDGAGSLFLPLTELGLRDLRRCD